MSISNGDIRRIFFANGFKAKQQENNTIDLNPYVFDAARALEKEVRAECRQTLLDMVKLLNLAENFLNEEVFASNGDVVKVTQQNREGIRKQIEDFLVGLAGPLE